MAQENNLEQSQERKQTQNQEPIPEQLPKIIQNPEQIIELKQALSHPHPEELLEGALNTDTIKEPESTNADADEAETSTEEEQKKKELEETAKEIDQNFQEEEGADTDVEEAIPLTAIRADTPDNHWRDEIIEIGFDTLERKIIEALSDYMDWNGFLVHPDLDEDLNNVSTLLKENLPSERTQLAEELLKAQCHSMLANSEEVRILTKLKLAALTHGIWNPESSSHTKLREKLDEHYIPSMQEIHVVQNILQADETKAQRYLRNLARVFRHDGYKPDYDVAFDRMGESLIPILLPECDKCSLSEVSSELAAQLSDRAERLEEGETTPELSAIFSLMAQGLESLRSELSKQSARSARTGSTDWVHYTEDSCFSDVIYELAPLQGQLFLPKRDKTHPKPTDVPIQWLPIFCFQNDTETIKHFLSNFINLLPCSDGEFQSFAQRIAEMFGLVSPGEDGSALKQNLEELRAAYNDISEPPENITRKVEDIKKRIEALVYGWVVLDGKTKKLGFTKLSDEDRIRFAKLLDVSQFEGISIGHAIRETNLFSRVYADYKGFLPVERIINLINFLSQKENAEKEHYSKRVKEQIIKNIASEQKTSPEKVSEIIEVLQQRFVGIACINRREKLLCQFKSLPETPTKTQVLRILEDAKIFYPVIEATEIKQIEEIYDDNESLKGEFGSKERFKNLSFAIKNLPDRSGVILEIDEMPEHELELKWNSEKKDFDFDLKGYDVENCVADFGTVRSALLFGLEILRPYALKQFGEFLKEEEGSFLLDKSGKPIEDRAVALLKVTVLSKDKVYKRIFGAKKGSKKDTSLVDCLMYHRVKTPSGVYPLGIFFDKHAMIKQRIIEILEQYPDIPHIKIAGRLIDERLLKPTGDSRQKQLDNARKMVTRLIKNMGYEMSKFRRSYPEQDGESLWQTILNETKKEAKDV